MKRRVAFTLVELLVVIVAIGMIVGLLLPAINAVRGSATSTTCKSNLRQLGLAMDAYLDAQGARGHYPHAAMLPSVTPDDPTLVDILGPHLEHNTAVFRCPGDDEFFRKEGLSYEYPSFRYAGKTRQQAQLSPFGKKNKRPTTEMWLLYDFESFHGTEGQEGARNVLYADGHVEGF